MEALHISMTKLYVAEQNDRGWMQEIVKSVATYVFSLTVVVFSLCVNHFCSSGILLLVRCQYVIEALFGDHRQRLRLSVVKNTFHEHPLHRTIMIANYHLLPPIEVMRILNVTKSRYHGIVTIGLERKHPLDFGILQCRVPKR